MSLLCVCVTVWMDVFPVGVCFLLRLRNTGNKFCQLSLREEGSGLEERNRLWGTERWHERAGFVLMCSLFSAKQTRWASTAGEGGVYVCVRKGFYCRKGRYFTVILVWWRQFFANFLQAAIWCVITHSLWKHQWENIISETVSLIQFLKKKKRPSQWFPKWGTGP